MELIRPFEKLSKGDAGIAGGKGASLGEMTSSFAKASAGQAGWMNPVPPGFVVLAGAFEKFLEEANLNQELDAIFHTVNHQEMRTVELASERIQKLIIEAKMPEDIAADIRENFESLGAQFVAVRSSATAEDSSSAAWAGQLDTYLNTTEETLLQNVQRCWASLFTPRAIFYRFEKGMHGQKISVAVAVQKMVQSEVSGIAFSVHPVTEDYNQLIIEAGFGLGEAIVSGQVTPDSFVIEKTPRRIIDKNITYQSRALWRAKDGGNEWRELSEEEGNKPALSDEQALLLAEAILTIENHYGFPCDIEWAYEAGQFYITQSRPITTLAPRVQEAEAMAMDVPIPFNGKDEWMLAENIPDSDYFFIQIPFTAAVEDTSYPFLKNYTQSLMDYKGLELNYYFGKKEAFEVGESILNALLERTGLGKEINEKIVEWSKKIVDLAEHIASLDLSKASNEELWQWYKEHDDTHTKLYTYGGLPIWLDMFHGNLTNHLKDYLRTKIQDPIEVEDAFVVLTTPSTKTIMGEEREEFFKLCLQYLEEIKKIASNQQVPSEKFSKVLASYAKRWGHLGATFAGNVEGFGPDHYLKELVDVVKSGTDIQKLLEREDTAPREAAKKKEALRAKLGMDDAHEELFETAAEFGRTKPIRRDTQLRTLYLLHRSLLEEIGKRLGASRLDAQFLLKHEVKEALVDGKIDREEVRARQTESVIYARAGDERVYREAAANALRKGIKREFDVNQKEFKGQVAQRGYAKGIVKIIIRAKDMEKMNQGDILVSIATDPDVVPAMKKAAAIITEQGGITSHAAIVSRELGTPCVIGTKIATKILKDGDLVEVDANTGTIRILERTQAPANNPEVAYYLNTPLVKMGQWAVYPIDQEIWMTEHTARYFEAEFGISKGPLVILTANPWLSHIYVPKPFFAKLHQRILEITKEDFRALEKLLQKFYSKRRETKDALAKATLDDFQSANTETLVTLYQRNRDLVHNIVMYDQFGWLAEEYWNVRMEQILTKKFKLEKDSAQYNDILFVLIKPREISTTLEEKRAALEMALGVHKEDVSLEDAAKKLSKAYGWMPVFAYGVPWDELHYRSEIETLLKKDTKELEKEYVELQKYSESRDEAIASIVEKYSMTPEDLQIFVDFGLALDARNEAEYCVSYAGFYLLPIYDEIARRLKITIEQIRSLFETEVVNCLLGKSDVTELLKRKEDIISWGFDEPMRNRMFFTAEQARTLYEYANRTAVLVGYDTQADEKKGICASPGKARGRARMIASPTESHRVEQGDILITYATTVDYLPAMKKAAAIITEVGGLTCHAAVVSREFGIPCIVSLKNAMSEFKDEEMIEVDADNGIVWKI